jgi:hypothetical protein
VVPAELQQFNVCFCGLFRCFGAPSPLCLQAESVCDDREAATGNYPDLGLVMGISSPSDFSLALSDFV